MSDITKLQGTIGADSTSGKAYYFYVTDEDESYWVPYSVTLKRTLTKIEGQDSVEVESWWWEKKQAGE